MILTLVGIQPTVSKSTRQSFLSLNSKQAKIIVKNLIHVRLGNTGIFLERMNGLQNYEQSKVGNVTLGMVRCVFLTSAS